MKPNIALIVIAILILILLVFGDIKMINILLVFVVAQNVLYLLMNFPLYGAQNFKLKPLCLR